MHPDMTEYSIIIDLTRDICQAPGVKKCMSIIVEESQGNVPSIIPAPLRKFTDAAENKKPGRNMLAGFAGSCSNQLQSCWGTWIRTRINGSKVRCPAVGRSPTVSGYGITPCRADSRGVTGRRAARRAAAPAPARWPRHAHWSADGPARPLAAGLPPTPAPSALPVR